ncbi:2870_t:CDS:2, partial [Dentiscutata erythropus]
MPKRTTLTDAQKCKLCIYAHDNKSTRSQYVNWIENKWGVRVDENERISSEITNPDAKCHRAVTYLALDYALKEFVLIYQNKPILSDAILVEKAKIIANGLGISEGALNFSHGWLDKFKDQNNICQHKLEGEAELADVAAIISTLPALRNKLEPDRSLATRHLSGCKVDRECLSIALCTNADSSHKMVSLIIGKYAKPRCFKNINLKNLAVMYKNSAKAWMITSLFQMWLQEFDHQVGLNWILEHVEKGEQADNLKMDVLQAIHYIVQDWEEVTAKTMYNIYQTVDPVLDDFTNALEDLHIHLSNPMLVEEFLSIPAEDIVYKIPEDNQVIEELIKTFKPVDLTYDDSEDNSIKISLISLNMAIASLETVCMFLLQQDEAN